MLKIVLFYIVLIFPFSCFSQDTKSVFVPSTKTCLKAGVTFNTANAQLHENLNKGYLTERYIQQNGMQINPYASVGIDYHFLKYMAIQFNAGFNQTGNDFTTPTYTVLNAVKNDVFTNYFHNNVFTEIMPAFAYKLTRVLVGTSFYVSSPSIKTTIVSTSLSTDKTTNYNEKTKDEISYHFYSQIGIMQGVKTDMGELTFSVSYFGLFKQYDSGINVALGFSIE